MMDSNKIYEKLNTQEAKVYDLSQKGLSSSRYCESYADKPSYSEISYGKNWADYFRHMPRLKVKSFF